MPASASLVQLLRARQSQTAALYAPAENAARDAALRAFAAANGPALRVNDIDAFASLLSMCADATRGASVPSAQACLYISTVACLKGDFEHAAFVGYGCLTNYFEIVPPLPWLMQSAPSRGHELVLLAHVTALALRFASRNVGQGSDASLCFELEARRLVGFSLLLSPDDACGSASLLSDVELFVRLADLARLVFP